MGCVRLYYNSETKSDASWLRDRAAFLCLLAVRQRRIRSRLWSTFYFILPPSVPLCFPLNFSMPGSEGSSPFFAVAIKPRSLASSVGLDCAWRPQFARRNQRRPLHTWHSTVCSLATHRVELQNCNMVREFVRTIKVPPGESDSSSNAV